MGERKQRKVGARRRGARRAGREKEPARPSRRRSRARGWRLAADVRPADVELQLALDPARSRSFRGEVTIGLTLARPRSALELHAADLRVHSARLEWNDQPLRGEIRLHPERQTVEVLLPRRIGPGPARLTLRFAGRLRDDLRGLYLARAGKRRYAFTQLEAAEARRVFPCFDEPALKARFRLSVTTAATHTVLSNSPVERLERLGDGRCTVHFAPTPPLSTYLLALAVGELEGSRTVHCGRTPIRIWHVPGKRGLTRFGLTAARECLARLEAYFGLPYPYEKLDLVAVPDFEAGAMENAGAVFFRETLLLVDPRTVTRSERKRVAEVICHELAHMWYGDLVTMAWWDDLWLNEAFATWMAFHVVDDWKPEWRMWNDFQHFRSAALELDALESTHPIYASVHDAAEATENFDLITYEKGASVVRMVERFLGARAFRSGVRRYIRRHREANATAADLWRALGEASGRDVGPVVRAWIEQPGFPLLRLERGHNAGQSSLRIRQSRFRGSPARTRQAAEKRDEERTRWPVPLVLRVGSGSGRARTVRALLERSRGEVDLGRGEPRFVYGNAEEGGFYRPHHDPAELARLADNLGRLAAVERMGLLGHQWALLRAGEAGVGELLELADRLGDEPDPDVLLSLRPPLAFLDQHVADTAGEGVRRQLRAWIAARFGAALERLGYAGRRREPPDRSLRRAALLGLVGGVAEGEPALAATAAQCEAYLRDPRRVDPNLADLVVALAARRGDARLFRSLRRSAGRAATPQERRRLLFGLADFRAPDLVDAALTLTLGAEVPTQDVAILLARMLANPDANQRAWAFATANWEALRRRMPPMLVTRVIDATPALQTRAYRREVARFFRLHPVPTGVRAVRQALERFDRNAELCRRAAPQLRDWLAQRAGPAADGR